MIQDMSIETVNKKLFTVDEFHRMSDAGILPESCRYELIRGEIVEMPKPESPHSGRVKRLNRLFTSRLGESVIVSVQDPLLIDVYSEPLPDIALLKPRHDFYETAHPTPKDVLLLVEISHKSVYYDGKIKTPLYAEAGIPEYWQLDVTKECLIVRTDPVEGEYRTTRILKRGETISPRQLPDAVFTLDELLG